MSTKITKILFRRGLNQQRLVANDTGITFDVGEPAFAVDTSRLYVGTGTQIGGVPVGMRNLGFVSQLYGSYGASGLTQEAYNLFSLSGAEVGDIVYDRTTRLIYTLSSINTHPPTANDLAKIDVSLLINPNQFEFNGLNQLQIKQEGIVPNLVAGSLAGAGLQKLNVNAPIDIQPNGVVNSMLAPVPAYSAKINNTTGTANPTDLVLRPKQVVGRTSTSTLTAVDFSVILSEASITGKNGITVVSPAPGVTYFSLSAGAFQIIDADLGPQYVNIFPATTVYNTFSAVGDIKNSGNLYTNNVKTFNGYINAGVGALTAGSTITHDIFTQNYPIHTGTAAIYCNGVQAGGGDINTSGNLAVGIINSGPIVAAGNINTTGDIYTTNLYASNDIIAFWTSDARLKDNLTPITDSLTSLDSLQGYTFTWKEHDANVRSGNDVGLLAQDVQKVLPQAVQERENGYLGVDYIKLIPYLVSCIKDLKQEVASLKDEIRQLSK